MSNKIIKYTHWGKEVSVYELLKGKHAMHCLCWANCKFFKPNTPENCPIAQELYEFDVKHTCVTPMWECPKFEKEEKPCADSTAV